MLKRIEKEKAQIEEQKARRFSLIKEIRKLRKELHELRRKTDVSHIQNIEVKRGKLGDEIDKLRQYVASTENNISLLQSRLEKVLKTAYNNLKVQIGKIERQISREEKEIEEALNQREALEEELTKLEKMKDELSRSVLTAKEEAKKFADQIDDIDKQLRKIDAEYEKREKLYNQLQIRLQTLQLQLDQCHTRLKELGYEEPLEVSDEQLHKVEASLESMRLELERLGAVNQLAPRQYEEQISRYRQLSMRINELEKERQAIISFMDEIERKKRNVFMETFHKINDGFSRYFHKLTGGGEAALKIENPEDPFSGGVDMVVQFPGKPSILVSLSLIHI